MVPKPLLPTTNESKWRSSTALHNFSLGSPQYTFATTFAWFKTSILQIKNKVWYVISISTYMIIFNYINTPLVLEAVSRISMTSTSLAIPYCFVKFISLNSSRGTKAATSLKKHRKVVIDCDARKNYPWYKRKRMRKRALTWTSVFEKLFSGVISGGRLNNDHDDFIIFVDQIINSPSKC